jgi:hypothetical protein
MDSLAGLNQIEDITLSIFPNPTTDFVTVVTQDDQIDQLMLQDLSGKVIKQEEVVGPKTQLDLSELPKGMYFIHALGEAGDRLTYCKVIKL